MEPTVTVTAVGQAPATPDQVAVLLAVETKSDTVGGAVSAASDAVAALVQVLSEAGVAEADRRTLGLSVQEHYGQNGPAGHAASYRLQAMVRDLAAAGALVQSAADSVGDALRVHGFALGVADPLPVLAQARADAVRACLQQADELARALGLRVGDVVELREGGSDGAAWHVAATGGMNVGFPVESGTFDSTVVVTGTWRLVAS